MMRIITAVAVFLGVPGWAWAQEVDSVILKDKREVKCKITSANAQGVNVTEGGKPKTYSAEEVREIFLQGDEPEGLRKANQASNSKNYDKAIPLYQTALEEMDKGGKHRAIHREFILFNLANAQLQKGDADAALGTLKKLRKECKGGWFMKRSYEFSLEVARKKGEPALMEVLGEMKNEPQPIGGEAEFQMARLKYEKKDYKGSQEIAARLGKMAGQPFVPRARVLNIQCLGMLKDTANLRTACKEVLDQKAGATPSLIQAAASGLGDILLAEAGNDEAKRREAILAYGQAIAMGPPPKDQSSDDYEEALFQAAKYYLAQSARAAKPESQAEYKGRAVNYLKELKESFKGSPRSKDAEKELAALGLGEKPKEPPKEAPKKP